jgi:hypothetical protein
MAVLENSFMTLKSMGLVTNHATFSVEFLGRGERYLADLMCSGRPVAVGALLSLFIRISAIADAFAATPSLSKQATELRELAAGIWAELELRTCALLPAGRKRPAPTRVVQGL